MSERKKEAILAIAKIMFQRTDQDHPLMQSEIAEILKDEYEIVMERKAIANSYKRLSEVGFFIESGSRGAYLDREKSTYLACGFTNAELRLLIDSIRCNRYLSVPHSHELIKKLEGLSNLFFAGEVRNISFLGDWDKSDNLMVYGTIQTLSAAIRSEHQVIIEYGKYGMDRRLHKSSGIHWSPYLLLWHNQRYYLMALNEKYHAVQFLRVDQMISVTMSPEPQSPIRDQPGFKNGIDEAFLHDLATARPYMYSDKASTIIFTIPKESIGEVVDWFGKDFIVTAVEPGSVPYDIRNRKGEPAELVRVRLRSSVMAMKFWALQYLDSVTVEYPGTLAEEIRKSLNLGAERYQNAGSQEK